MSPRYASPERPRKETLGDIEAILIDTAVEVGALIDAVCCRIGDWVDWQHYRPHPKMSVGNHEDPGSIIRLALTENDCGLRAGGYIEICVLSKDRVIEANGGYYDAYHQPKPVIDGSFRWHEVNHQSLGQVLMVMYDKIMRKYMEHTEFEESQERHLGVWAEKPTA